MSNHNTTYANVSVTELRRAYNNDKETGRTHFVESMAPTYMGRKINIVFGKFGMVDYMDVRTGEHLASFQDLAVIDD